MKPPLRSVNHMIEIRVGLQIHLLQYPLQLHLSRFVKIHYHILPPYTNPIVPIQEVNRRREDNLPYYLRPFFGCS